ncbi:MAG TPA: ABC transporter ATP-binding protein [Syntrophorhabdales bacterium]|nr:ABC transporter ATP-binding protein [Syntrophorhabdales bacterium]
MEPMIKAVSVENLSRSFEGIQALSNVSFTANKGERLVIIGPNGAGKTTLFHLITGEIPPTDGRVFLFGQNATYMPPYRRTQLGIARTFQITNLFPNLTLQENILLAVLGVSRQKFMMHHPVSSCKEILARIDRFLALWDLQPYKQSLVRDLSYGVQRQVEVIMALSGGARIVLLDEPTSGLSAAETKTMTSIILGLDPEMTLIIIEHDMDVAFRLAHTMVVLHHGMVLAVGPPAEIRADLRIKEIYLGAEGQATC